MDVNEGIARYFAKYPTGTIRGTEDETGLTLFVTGSMDLNFSQDLQNLLSWSIGQLEGQKRLIIDLDKVNYLSSTGVGALSNALIEARKRNLPLFLRNMQPRIRSVFELLGLMNFFDEIGPNG